MDAFSQRRMAREGIPGFSASADGRDESTGLGKFYLGIPESGCCPKRWRDWRASGAGGEAVDKLTIDAITLRPWKFSASGRDPCRHDRIENSGSVRCPGDGCLWKLVAIRVVEVEDGVGECHSDSACKICFCTRVSKPETSTEVEGRLLSLFRTLQVPYRLHSCFL